MDKLTSWDMAKRLKVCRKPHLTNEKQRRHCSYKFGELERGVNYFILQLEKMGVKTAYSCEGHPHGFYVSFYSPYDIARKVSSVGFFSVQLMGDKNHFAIYLNNNDIDITERQKRRILRMASRRWDDVFGKLPAFEHGENT